MARNALGLIEVYGFATSVAVADAAAKAADVKIVALDKNKPANASKCRVPLQSVIKIEGGISEVRAAVEAGSEAAKERGLFSAAHVISQQEEGTAKMAAIGATGKDHLR